ncbi:Putative cytosolic protein [Staphylococcus aureus]|nr:Putative cytosolic protein [Staphylococcus aureus]
MKMWTINELLILKKVNTIDTHTKEQQFSNLVRSYRKEYVGKGPNSIRVSFKDNWAIAHMTGVLSKVESFYLNDKRNESMLHYTRTEKIKQMYKEIDVNEMESLVGAKFVKLFTDIDLNDDEVISIFVFDKSIE